MKFSFTATVTDVDLPAQVLTFSLVGGPEGAAINAATGIFTWTPSEEQEITLTITEINAAPVADHLTATTPEETIVDVTLDEMQIAGARADDPRNEELFCLYKHHPTTYCA